MVLDSRKEKRYVEIGGAEEDRTPDLRIANATLSQLSYRPIAELRYCRWTGAHTAGAHCKAPVGRAEVHFSGERSI